MHRKTREILDIFTQINRLPRCSKNEAAISKWLTKWAETNGFASKTDAIWNLVIEVPASPGYENAPVVVLQGHMDMVCEKTPDSNHDFSRDPIKTIVEGDWVTADRTTLGADNGIALAIAMAYATDSTVRHPPLELLFTVDEETGLNGAKEITPDFFHGRVYLNIDSETEGVFTAGCAGGRDIRILVPFEPSPVTHGNVFKISVGGLRGGHSGIDIHRHRANANILLARTLKALGERMNVRLSEMFGGSVHNAIPRDAAAVIVCDGGQVSETQHIVAGFEQTARSEFASTEKGLRIRARTSKKCTPATLALTVQETKRVIEVLLSLPNGVLGMSPDMEGLVETSNNLATLNVKGSVLEILTSHRSSIRSRLDEVSTKIRAVAALGGLETEIENEYPAWPPNLNSPLLERCKHVYEKQFGSKPVVEVIHAGLECAIIGSKMDGVDMISFGPDLENPHSPDERLNIPSIEKVWSFLTALLESYSSGSTGDDHRRY